MSDRNDILVAGAGIAGLTAALSLAQRGFVVTLIETFQQPSEIGAGIQVAPNATRILRALGVLDAFEERAAAPTALRLADAVSGKQVLEMPIDAEWLDRMGAPYLTAHRAHLHAALYEAAVAHPGISVRTGWRAEAVEEKTDGVVLTLRSHQGETETLDAPALIGADGIWSSIRAAVPGARTPRPTGRVAWRAIAPAGSAEGANRVTAWMAPDSHVVTYPVRNAETLNIVAITRGSAEPGDWAQARDSRELSELFKALRSDVELSVSERASWTLWPLYAVEPGSAHSSSRVLLIGDAAHGMEPFAAQGAAMAIEDGYAAGQAFGNAPDAPSRAIVDYLELRKKRIAEVQKRTAFNRWVYHQSGPGRHARNMYFSVRPGAAFLRDLEWIYGYSLPPA